jgi:hypothetical protein
MRLQKQFPTDNGNEADIDSNCSSPMISSLPSRFKWSSVRSIGYDNEYEFKNYDFEPGESQYSLCSSSNLNETQESFDESKCVGGHTVDFRMIDDTGDEPRCSDKAVSSNTTKAQVEHLSKAIRENFGEFELEMFPEFKSF